MNKDPIIDEIHQIRQQLWQQAGGTFAGLRAHAHETVKRIELATQAARQSNAPHTIMRRRMT